MSPKKFLAMDRNIIYQTDQTAHYFSRNRVSSDIFAFVCFGAATYAMLYEKLRFFAFPIRKRKNGDQDSVRLDFNVPEKIQAVLELLV